MTELTYYEVLGVSPHASDSELYSAYTNLVSKHHPDKHVDSPSKDAHFELYSQIDKSYQTLSDPVMRKLYDLEHNLVSPSNLPTFYEDLFDECKSQAEKAQRLMSASYESSLQKEREEHGLSILLARYGDPESITKSKKGHYVDVVKPLQCAVEHGRLIFPLVSGSLQWHKGFYDPNALNELPIENKLFLIYEFDDTLHSVWLNDDSRIELPQNQHRMTDEDILLFRRGILRKPGQRIKLRSNGSNKLILVAGGFSIVAFLMFLLNQHRSQMPLNLQFQQLINHLLKNFHQFATYVHQKIPRMDRPALSPSSGVAVPLSATSLQVRSSTG